MGVMIKVKGGYGILDHHSSIVKEAAMEVLKKENQSFGVAQVL